MSQARQEATASFVYHDLDGNTIPNPRYDKEYIKNYQAHHPETGSGITQLLGPTLNHQDYFALGAITLDGNTESPDAMNWKEILYEAIEHLQIKMQQKKLAGEASLYAHLIVNNNIFCVSMGRSHAHLVTIQPDHPIQIIPLNESDYPQVNVRKMARPENCKTFVICTNDGFHTSQIREDHIEDILNNPTLCTGTQLSSALAIKALTSFPINNISVIVTPAHSNSPCIQYAALFEIGEGNISDLAKELSLQFEKSLRKTIQTAMTIELESALSADDLFAKWTAAKKEIEQSNNGAKSTKHASSTYARLLPVIRDLAALHHPGATLAFENEIPAEEFDRALSENNVNIYKYPKIKSSRPHPTPSTHLTMGDLHGNAIKLLFFLIYYHIMDFPEPQKELYEKVVKLYLKPLHTLRVSDLIQFSSLVHSLILVNHTNIRFLGDILADRGSNDYFTLKILQKMTWQQLGLEIILSNHDMDFIRIVEQNLLKNDGSFYPTVIVGANQSLHNMGYLIHRPSPLIEPAEILDMFHQIYKPALKLLSYSIHPENNTIYIYTHATVGCETIEALAKFFGTNYSAESMQALGQSIDDINKEFKCLVDNGNIFERSEVGSLINDQTGIDVNPITRIIWNRRYLDCHMVPELNGFNIVYVHGHDGLGKLKDEHIGFVINMDNTLGRTATSNIGMLSVLCLELSIMPIIENEKKIAMNI